MNLEEQRRRRRTTLGAVAGLVLAALVVVRLVAHRPLDLDLPDVDLPDWLRWVGPVLGAGKLLFLVGLGVLAVLGEWERRRRSPGKGSR